MGFFKIRGSKHKLEKWLDENISRGRLLLLGQLILPNGEVVLHGSRGEAARLHRSYTWVRSDLCLIACETAASGGGCLLCGGWRWACYSGTSAVCGVAGCDYAAREFIWALLVGFVPCDLGFRPLRCFGLRLICFNYFT